MGNKLREEDLTLNITVNGDKGKKELGDLEKSTRDLTNRNKELRTEKEKLIRAGKQESAEYKAVTKEITENNRVLKTNETRMTELRRQIGLTGLTMQQLRAEQTRLKNLLNTSTYGTTQWNKLKKDLNAVENQMAKVNGGGQKMQSILGNLMPAVGITAIIAGIGTLGTKIFGVRKEFEKYQAVLANSLGSQRAAAKELNMLSDLAAETPFQLSELTSGFVKLTNYGLKPSREEMRKYGDVAASVGKTFEQYVEAIADATQFEFERLKEFGIRASKNGDIIKFTFKGITTEVQANSEAVKDYMASLGDLKGVSGSMKAISQTMGGASSNMADAFDRLMNKWGSGGISQYLVTQMRNITAFMSNLAGKTPTLVEELSKVRSELDKELTILRAGNFTADERATTIRRINTEYKDYLPNLLDEKASLTDIEKYHNLINGHMQARIIYASYEEDIKDILKQQTEALAGNYEIEKKRTELNLGMNPTMRDRNPDVLNKLLDQATGINNSIVENTDKKTAEVKEKYEFMAKSIGMTFGDIEKMVNSFNASKIKPTQDDKPKTVRDNDKFEPLTPIQANQVTPEDIAFASKKRTEAEWTKFLNAQVNKQIAIKQREFEIEKEIEQAREELKDMRINAIGQIAGALSGMFEQGSAAQIAFFAIEKAIAIAQVWTNYAKESSAIHAASALMGPAGIPYDAIMQAKALTNAGINTGIIAAQAVAQAIGNSKSKTKGYASGGYANEETYRVAEQGPEFIASNPAVRNPEVKQFLDIFDYYQRTGQISKLNTKMILANLPVQQMYVGGYSSKGSASSGSVSNVPNVISGSPRDPELTAALNRLSSNLEKGIRASINKYGVNGLEEAMKDIENFNSKVFK